MTSEYKLAPDELNSQHHEATYKDMLDAAPAAEQKPTLEVWILYDATTDKKYIKMDPSDGSLAIFDSEEAAMSAKRLNYGTEYSRCEYYSAPQPAPAPEVVKLEEALEEMIDVAHMVDSFPFYPIERAEKALALYRKQVGDL